MNMTAKKALSVQDISCFGQCSNTVVFPLLSAAGVETVMLPTALLSTHTGGFQGFTFLDLTAEMEKILAHFDQLGISFDYLATGYCGSAEQLDLLLSYLPRLMKEDSLRLVDPVLGDNGKLYSIYDAAYVAKMRKLVSVADVITPNVTEACLLADLPVPEGHVCPADFLRELFSRLHALGPKRVLLTGVMFDEKTIGVIGSEGEQTFEVKSPFVDRYIHGTGDMLAGSFLGFLSRGKSFRDAAERAVRFVSDCIADTLPTLDEHWYGISFEHRLSELSE